jgi:hypothetical protein
MADLASKNTDSITKAFQAGLISQKVALKELRQQSEMTGMWSNVTDEDIEKADDEVMNPDEGMGGMPMGMGGDEPPESTGASEKGEGEQVPKQKAEPPQNGRQETREAKDSRPFDLAGDEWNESDHPRDESGRFRGGNYNTAVHVDKETLSRYNATLRGIVTSQGTRINKVTGHSTGRMIERGITPEMIKDILTSPNTHVKPGGTPRTTCYEKDGMRYVVDHEKGNLVTVMHIYERR